MRKVLVLGATSAIAQALARLFAQKGDELYLVGRNPEKLKVIGDDLLVRGATKVHLQVQDLAVAEKHEALVKEAKQTMGELDIALLAHGTLPSQDAAEKSYDQTYETLNVNGLSYISLLTHLGNEMENAGKGTLVVIASVAGERGRQSNYVYGTAKSMVTTFTQGLRNRLSKKGIPVLTVQPGFVDTPMTKDFDKGLLWAQPEQVARSIDKAIFKGRDVIYTPFFWRYIMLIIKLIPERIFKRLSL